MLNSRKNGQGGVINVVFVRRYPIGFNFSGSQHRKPLLTRSKSSIDSTSRSVLNHVFPKHFHESMSSERGWAGDRTLWIACPSAAISIWLTDSFVDAKRIAPDACNTMRSRPPLLVLRKCEVTNPKLVSEREKRVLRLGLRSRTPFLCCRWRARHCLLQSDVNIANFVEGIEAPSRLVWQRRRFFWSNCGDEARISSKTGVRDEAQGKT